MAHLSEDEALIAAFHSGADFHAATASSVFGVALERGHAEQRRQIKAMNYGLAYGLSAFGLSQQLSIPPRRPGRSWRSTSSGSAASATTCTRWSSRRATTATPRPCSAAAATCPT